MIRTSSSMHGGDNDEPTQKCLAHILQLEAAVMHQDGLIPVKDGDLLFLQSTPGKNDTFLRADILDNVIMDVVDDGATPKDFDECLWRICPQLSYADQEVAVRLQKSPSFDENEMKALLRRSSREKEKNDAHLKAVSKGQGQLRKYGQIVQLQHVRSGKFLCATNTSAKVDRECLKLELVDGSSDCYFRILPRFKVRAEGGPIYYGDEIVIASNSFKDFSLHQSAENLAGPGYIYREANLGTDQCSVTVNLYTRYEAQDTAALRTGPYLRFLHREAEAYLQASTQKKDGRDQVPYLKKFEGSDPTHPDVFTAKSVFTIEKLLPRYGGKLKWCTEYRIRHIPSGKYLTISDEFILTEEAEEGEVCKTMLLTADTKDPVKRAQQLFQLVNVNEVDEYIPASGAMMMLAHHSPVDGKMYYLHDTNTRKSAEKTSSSILCMSTMKRTQDALTIMDVETELCTIMKRTASFVPIARQYSAALLDGKVVRARAQLAAQNNMLRELLFDVVMGEQDENDDALDLEGPPNENVQNIARELKLLDALLDMTSGPSNAGISLQYDNQDQAWIDSKFLPYERIHKLAFKSLRYLVMSNHRSEMYFVRCTTQIRDEIISPPAPVARQATDDSYVGDEGASEEKSDAPHLKADRSVSKSLGELITIDAMQALIRQVPYPVGAADALNTLISNNVTLLNEKVDATTINFFKNLISSEGPQARFLAFFTSICACQGRQIIGNQELCLRELYLDDARRRDLLLYIHSIPDALPKQQWLSSNDPRAEFLGQEKFRSGFDRVFVSWVGSDEWVSGSDEFFFSPAYLNIPEEEYNGQKYVALEQLLWPLDGPRLCEKVTGRSWRDVSKRIESDDDFHDKFYLHKQVAEYFCEELHLFAEMCLERSYNAIYALEKELSYELVVSQLANEKLPDEARGLFALLMNRLYIDRYPHDRNCGRQSLPDKIWLFPDIQQVDIAQPGALPQFKIPASSPLVSHPEPFYRIRDSNKFHLIQDFVNYYFVSMGARQIMDDRKKNTFLLHVLNLVKSLTVFGFYGNRKVIADICKPLIETLDGRGDTKFESDQSAVVSDEPVDNIERYTPDENSILVVQSKAAMIDTMFSMSKLRAHYRLANFLNIFKQWRVKGAGNAVSDELVTQFLNLFDSESGKQLDFDLMTQVPLDTILLDLLMYKDNALFANALKLLLLEHAKVVELFSSAEGLAILTTREIPVFGTFQGLEGEISRLRNYLDSYETWGVSNDFSQKDYDTYTSIYDIFGRLREFILTSDGQQTTAVTSPASSVFSVMNPLHSSSPKRDVEADTPLKPVKKHQDLLNLLDVFSVLLDAMDMDYRLDSSDEGSQFNLKSLINSAIDLIRLFVMSNSKNQKLAMSQFERLLARVESFQSGLLSVFKEIYRGNQEICAVTPKSLFEVFTDLAISQSDEKLLEFLEQQILPADVIVQRNQQIVANCLLARLETSFFTSIHHAPAEQQLFRAKLVKILAMCCVDGTADVTVRCQRLLPYDQVAKMLKGKAASCADPLAMLYAYTSFLDAAYISSPLRDVETLSGQGFWDLLAGLAEHAAAVALEEKIDENLMVLAMISAIDNAITAMPSAASKQPEEISNPLMNSMLDIAKTPHISPETKQRVVRIAESFGATAAQAKEPEEDQPADTLQLARRNSTIPFKVGASAVDERAMSADEDKEIELQFAMFLQLMRESAQVQELLVQERGAISKIIAQVAELTDPRNEEYVTLKTGQPVNRGFLAAVTGNREGDEARAAVAKADRRTNVIQFSDVITRMVNYVRTQMREEDLGVCTDVLKTLTRYLEEGEQMDEEAGEEAEASEMERRQEELNDLGVTVLVYDVIAYHAGGALFDAAVELGLHLLEGGNSECQAALIQHIATTDSDGKFFLHIRDRIRTITQLAAKLQVSKAEEEEEIDETIEDLGEKGLAAIRTHCAVLRFLQLCCEGHNLSFQNILAAQPNNRTSYNLIEAVIELLEALSPRQDIIRYTGAQAAELMLKTFAFLTESIQGPCPENQAMIASKKAFEVCKMILSTQIRKVNSRTASLLKFAAVKLMASCCEGRSDLKVQYLLAEKVDQDILDDCILQFYAKSNEIDEHLAKGNSELYEDDDLDAMKDAILDLYTVRMHLAKTSPVVAESLALERPKKLAAEAEPKYEAHEHFQERLAKIEVYWGGRTDEVLFPVPDEASAFPETTKRQFLNSADLSTQDGRVKQLLESADAFIDEMSVLHTLREDNFFIWVRDHYFDLKWLLFVLALLLNINIILSFDTDQPYLNDSSTQGAEAITVTLAIVLCVGYLILAFYWLKSKSPIQKRALDRYIASTAESQKTPTYYDFTVWYTFLVAATLYVLGCVIHGVAIAPTVYYLYIAIVVFGSYALYTYRHSIILPFSRFEYTYCRIYDLCTDLDIAEHVIMAIFAVPFGLMRVYLFVIILLDVVSMSEQMKNVIRSVYQPWRSLVSVGFLFILVVLAFAIFGYFLFGEDTFVMSPGDMEVDDGGNITITDDVGCTSLLACVFLVLYGGVRPGDISEIMGSITAEDGNFWYKRVLFDMAFFLVLGVLLFDMVTGIIVDTFSALREETEARFEILKNECFVSGLTREQLDEQGLDFESLQEKDQNLWNYLYYVLYLRQKDPNEYNGVEQYVADCLANEDNSWFPARTSAALENAGAAAEVENSTEERLNAIDARMASLESLVERVFVTLEKK